MRVRSLVYRQTAVVAVEAGLIAVGRWEDDRNHLEVVWCLCPGAPGEHVVGVAGIDTLAEVGARRRSSGRRARRKYHGRSSLERLIRHSLSAVVADAIAVITLGALIGGGEVVVEPSIRVDRANFLPGQAAVERLRHLDVKFAIPVVLPHGVQMVVLSIVLGDPRIVVGTDEGAGDALLRAAPEVAQRLADRDVTPYLDRRHAIEVGGSGGGIPGR